jgi:hypothetical protein
MTVLDPVKNTMSQIAIPFKAGTPMAEPPEVLMPSPYWGTETVAISHATAHSLMMDSQGRIWTAAATRDRDNPAFCKQGSTHPSAIAFPLEKSSRQTNVYDPKTKQWTLIDMCASSQHLMFAEDASSTLWFSNPGGDNVGWFNTKMWDQTHDVEKSQGWTPLILDTNANGKRDAYVEPDQPIDPAKDKRIKIGFYAVGPSPVDSSIWGTALGFPGALVRLNPGSDPSKTALAEIYEVPWNNPKAPVQGDIMPASIAASARVRSMDPQRLDSTAPKAGRSTAHRAPPSRESTKELAALTQTITTGSINSTRSAWARIHRSSQEMETTRWRPWIRPPESGLSCEFPTRWASSPRAWMGASTIRKAAGKAKGCGQRMRPARPGTWKAARGQRARL